MVHLRFATISELRNLLRKGTLTATELARASLQMLETRGHELNAVAKTTAQLALQQAAAADRRLAGGRGGALCGIPWGAKDVLATAGIRTGWGAPPFDDQVFDYDATVVRRLEGANAVLVAKLAMVEMAGAGLYRFATASTNGACHNPWDAARWSGGSSSGSAAAVAGGLIPFSIGSETGGSLVIPAAFCGVTALRPSAGTVSRHGALVVGWSLDKLGPIAHTAADCATVFAAMAGVDEFDASTADYTYRPTRRNRFRIGVLRQPSGDPQVNRCFDSALTTFLTLGCELREVELPSIDLRELHDRLVAGETAAAHEDFIRGPRLGELIDDAQKDAMAEYLTRSPASYPRAAVDRAQAARAIRAIFTQVDALVAPTVLTEAVSIDEDLLNYRHERRGGNMFLGSVAGLPELTVPMGLGSNGMPIAISIIGDRYHDATVLRLGALFQRETTWHAARPLVASVA